MVQIQCCSHCCKSIHVIWALNELESLEVKKLRYGIYTLLLLHVDVY